MVRSHVGDQGEIGTGLNTLSAGFPGDGINRSFFFGSIKPIYIIAQFLQRRVTRRLRMTNWKGRGRSSHVIF